MEYKGGIWDVQDTPTHSIPTVLEASLGSDVAPSLPPQSRRCGSALHTGHYQGQLPSTTS
jgi:hypothetical protein